ncbi:hypothetical protein [Mycolicibacterium mageritense]|uniref:Uncharacterized protein n=1 Tax=Mycolicibacterium mageritense TaxID=53462 RepID=A0AAI8TZL3_MYCME|nr:hypothetical protein [Mycolicibacterium mageritense]BDY31400.1 hypothetical protein hbim_05352 [Mycolicibacterium mageritense]
MDLEQLRANGRKPVRIVTKGSRTTMFIGDEEFNHPIALDSMSVKPGRGPYNELTLTLFVGEVTFENPTAKTEAPE